MISNWPRPMKSLNFTGEPKFLENHFEDLWSLICDEFLLDRLFTVEDVAAVLQAHHGWRPNTATQYAKAVLHQALRTTDQDDPSIVRVSSKYWKLPGLHPDEIARALKTSSRD